MRDIFLNGYETVQAIGFLFFFVIGWLIYTLDETSGRSRPSRSTPIRFSFKFWIGDNWKRYLATILITFVFFRFYDQFTGHDPSYFECVMLGMIGDGLGAKLKGKVKAVQVNRTRLLLKEDPDNVSR